MRFTKKLRSQKGFSLIELLTVVGIIGVLAAVGVPKYTKYQAKSKAAAGMAMGQIVSTAQEAYHSANAIYGTEAQLNVPAGTIPTTVPTGFAKTYTAPTAAAWSMTLAATAGQLGSCAGAVSLIFNETGTAHTGLTNNAPTGCE